MIALTAAFVLGFHVCNISVCGFIMMTAFVLCVTLFPNTVEVTEQLDPSCSASLLLLGTTQVVFGSLAGPLCAANLCGRPLIGPLPHIATRNTWFTWVQLLTLMAIAFAYLTPSPSIAALVAMAFNAGELVLLYCLHLRNRSLIENSMYSPPAVFLVLGLALCVIAPWCWFLFTRLLEDTQQAAGLTALVLLLYSIAVKAKTAGRYSYAPLDTEAAEDASFVIEEN